MEMMCFAIIPANARCGVLSWIAAAALKALSRSGWVVAGIFFGLLNQKPFTLPYLFPENSLKFFLCHNSPRFTP